MEGMMKGGGMKDKPMPFKSRAQARAMMAKDPIMAEKCSKETDWENLPETAAQGETVARVRERLKTIRARKA